MLSFFNRTFTQFSTEIIQNEGLENWNSGLKNWNSDATYFQKYKKSTLRKAYKKWTSILGFIFFNKTFTQIFKKSIVRTIFIWRHCKSPRSYHLWYYIISFSLSSIISYHLMSYFIECWQNNTLDHNWYDFRSIWNKRRGDA